MTGELRACVAPGRLSFGAVFFAPASVSAGRAPTRRAAGSMEAPSKDERVTAARRRRPSLPGDGRQQHDDGATVGVDAEAILRFDGVEKADRDETARVDGGEVVHRLERAEILGDLRLTRGRVGEALRAARPEEGGA